MYPRYEGYERGKARNEAFTKFKGWRAAEAKSNMKAATPPAGGVKKEAAGGLEMVLKALFSVHGELPDRRRPERKNYDRLA